MPKFTFKLEGVLNLRKRGEQEAQRALANRLAEANRLQDELRRLNTDLVEASNELRTGHLTGPIDISYLTAHRRYTASVAKRGSDLMSRLALAERAVTEARQQLAEAAKQRKVLETLRDKHEARWRADLIRRELAEADDAASQWVAMIRRDEAEGESAADWVAATSAEGERS